MSTFEIPFQTQSSTTHKHTAMARRQPASQQPPAKFQWGDLDEDDSVPLEFLLAPREVIGPDQSGVKKVIEYRFDDEGQKVKVTSTFRTRKLSKRVAARRSWPKFGDAAAEDASESRTVVSAEEIVIERPNAWRGKAIEAPVAKPGKEGGTALMVCRSCGKKGDHWTARCPLKELAQTPEPDAEKGDKATAVADKASTKYVPPRQREGAEMRHRNDENSVRVSNLSEDTREPDLLELFQVFGGVSRVHVVVDQRTKESRGFGFVNFVNREDAQRAINKLNGYGYDNLILRVEWAIPRAK